MASLAENVMNGAQEAQTAQGQTVGNAINAYTLAQDTQMKREKLEQDKQQNELNKANWLNSQIVAIGRQPEGAARDLMLKGFSRQLPSVVPGANPDITELFKRDPEMLRKATEAAQHYMNNQQFDPTALNGFFSMSTPEAIDTMNKAAENIAKIKAAQLGMTAVKRDALEEQMNVNAGRVGQLYEQDAILKLSKTNVNALKRSENILSNPKLPVTAKDLNLAYTDYINAVAAGGAATEGKITRELPDTFETMKNDLLLKVGVNADLRKTDAGKALIEQLQGRITGVHHDIQQAIAEQAKNLHTSNSLSSNPKVKAVNDLKLQQYTAQAAPAQAAGPTEGATQTYNGAIYKVIGGHWVKQGAQQAGGMGGQ